MELTSPSEHHSITKITGILDLPKDVQIIILKKLPYKELIHLVNVSKHFENLIKNETPMLLKNVNLPGTFLNVDNRKALTWLSSKGNLEATIKLGFAHLYFEGLVDSASVRQQNSVTAAKYFYDMEQNERLKSPVTWVFIRPPWSAASVCRKAFVYKHLLKLVEESSHPHLLYCIGKVLQLFEDDLEKRQSAKQWFLRASDQGLPHAMFELWCMELEDAGGFTSIGSFVSSRSPGHRLCLIRRLRKIASLGYQPAQMQLCKLYAMGNFAGLPMHVALEYTKTIIQKSISTQKDILQNQQSVNASMRYILVDWLIEVATMKDFGSEMLHATIQCVDRYLSLRQVSRSRLQLLGIACMVICTRYMERDVLTIREAVWLTDSTYKYNELVQMIEDVVATLNGNIKELTVFDYLSIFLNSDLIDRKCQEISQFIVDASLLHVDTVILSPGISASASIFLANLSMNVVNPWSAKLFNITGYTEEQLFSTAIEIHERCLNKEPPTDFRNRKLDAVEERYSQCRCGPIKRSQLISHVRLISYIQTAYDTSEIFGTLSCSSYSTSAFNHSQDLSSADADNVMSEEETILESSTDESELETDTPPTLSSAYLMRTDIKTRKRIKANRLAESKSFENLPTTSKTESTTEKVFPKKRSIDKSNSALTIIKDKENNRLSVPGHNNDKYSFKHKTLHKIGSESRENSSKKIGRKDKSNKANRSSRSPRMRT